MFPVPTLFHATRASNLPSIMEHGLKAEFHGRVHGAMDYEPAGPSVYLSIHSLSSNLNGRLFRDEAGREHEVVVLEIDATLLDPELAFPDDSMFYLLDADFVCDWEEEDEEGRDDAAADFARRYGIDPGQARDILDACAAEGEARYPHILRPVWRELLTVEGEIAYMGDVPPAAITAVRPYAPEEDGPQAAKP